MEFTSEEHRGGHEIGRRAHPPGRALHPRGPLEAPPTDFFRLYIPIYPKTIGEQNRLGVPPPQASVATKNQWDPVPAPCRRGDPSPVAIFIIPALSMTWRDVTSLVLVCSRLALRVCIMFNFSNELEMGTDQTLAPDQIK